MSAPKREDQLNLSDVVEQWLDQLDPTTSPAVDATPLRRIMAANKELVDADVWFGQAVELREAFAAGQASAGAHTELRAAVTDAREAGFSWVMVAMALDISREVAERRFAQP